jgi:hypothetical protein
VLTATGRQPSHHPAGEIHVLTVAVFLPTGTSGTSVAYSGSIVAHLLGVEVAKRIQRNSGQGFPAKGKSKKPLVRNAGYLFS